MSHKVRLNTANVSNLKAYLKRAYDRSFVTLLFKMFKRLVIIFFLFIPMESNGYSSTSSKISELDLSTHLSSFDGGIIYDQFPTGTYVVAAVPSGLLFKTFPKNIHFEFFPFSVSYHSSELISLKHYYPCSSHHVTYYVNQFNDLLSTHLRKRVTYSLFPNIPPNVVDSHVHTSMYNVTKIISSRLNNGELVYLCRDYQHYGVVILVVASPFICMFLFYLMIMCSSMCYECGLFRCVFKCIR